MTTNKPEVVAWGNDPRKMSETDLLPCPNCNHQAGKATRRAAKGLPFVGLWKVSCQRPECPLAMIYFHPVEWNRLPRIRQSEYAALQAECEKLRAALKRLCNIYVVDDYYSGEERERRLDEAVRRSIDAVGGLEHE